MNCKPGEMAWIVKSGAGNEGKMVTCIRLATEIELYNASFVKTSGPVWVIDTVLPLTRGNFAPLCRDSSLRPHRPGDLQDEVNKKVAA